MFWNHAKSNLYFNIEILLVDREMIKVSTLIQSIYAFAAS